MKGEKGERAGRNVSDAMQCKATLSPLRPKSGNATVTLWDWRLLVPVCKVDHIDTLPTENVDVLALL